MIFPTLEEERKLWKKGFRYICGVDEVGRGAFAGPVVVGAVIFSASCDPIKGVTDSKLLSPKERKKLERQIKQQALDWFVSEIGVSSINKLGIGKATQAAFRKAVRNLKIDVDYILVDAFHIKYLKRKNQKAIIKGDQKSYSIAAASIIAKVYRDELMVRLDEKYPKYGFAKNKGYGTKIHQEAIKKYGLSRVHRTSFNYSCLLLGE